MRSAIKTVLKLFGLLLISIALLFTFCAWQVYRYATYPRALPNHADAVVVLGAAAWGDRPSPVFRERINHGITLYQNKQVDKIIFTGGTPKIGYPTEAQVAKRYAQQKYLIPSQNILLDTESTNTYDNLINTRTLMHNHQLHSIIIVSDPDHLARAAAMANHLGITASVSATPSSRYYGNRQNRLKFMLQETLSLMYFYISQYTLAI